MQLSTYLPCLQISVITAAFICLKANSSNALLIKPFAGTVSALIQGFPETGKLSADLDDGDWLRLSSTNADATHEGFSYELYMLGRNNILRYSDAQDG